ncbi:hypothetical protein PG999_014768 [Apiospora kogelbergensis]|uniref:Methyltransferase domain-containing protein n=1 Tax=Apiospora kogelbergensis TaxID=1337665 RepID=A0AAW0Q5U6_9PEZI
MNSTTGTEQYDSIGAQYEAIKSLPIIRDVETATFRKHALELLDRGKSRVLDLACGTGFYSEKLLEWGAASVTGVDVSPTMVDVARAKAKKIGKDADGRLKYLVGDVLNLGVVDGGGYDFVTGVWLLNYASSREEMAQMYRGIRANLKPDGLFFGVCEESQEDLDEFVRRRQLLSEGDRKLFGLETEYTERLASGDGYVMISRAHVPPPHPPFTMKTYHLRRSVYQEAARAAGLVGRYEMETMDVPDEVYKKDKDYWALYPISTPKFSMIFVAAEDVDSTRSLDFVEAA